MTAVRKRIDKWLWHPRVVRTRTTDAAVLVGDGLVRLNGGQRRDALYIRTCFRISSVLPSGLIVGLSNPRIGLMTGANQFRRVRSRHPQLPAKHCSTPSLMLN